MGGLISLITSNFGTILAAILGGGVLISSIRYIREYERGVVTRFGRLVRDSEPNPDSDGIREYTGFVPRIPGLWRVSVVNIRDRTDQLSVDGVERIGLSGRLEKWKLQATVKWHVREGYVYSGCQWQIEDIGEFVRGEIENGLFNVLRGTNATLLYNSDEIFDMAEDFIKDRLLVHGVVWTELMVKEFARVDAEVQAQAIEKVSLNIGDKP